MAKQTSDLSDAGLGHLVYKDKISRLVRSIRNDPALEVLDWTVERLGGGSTSAGVYRVAGTASEGVRPVAWSLILKSLPSPSQDDEGSLAPAADSADSNYWKREFLVYNSGLLERLPPEFGAVRCYLAEEEADACYLWLEDMGDMGRSMWSPERFGLVAHHLGLFNGVWSTEQAVPAYTWLDHSLVRERAFAQGLTATELPARIDVFGQAYPALANLWDANTVAATQILCDDRARFLQALDRLPKTIQHQDTGQKNLAIRTSDREQTSTVAIDWGFTGLSAIGGDLAYLVVSTSRWFGDVTPEQLPEIEGLTFDAYRQGLFTAGWQGNAQDVRLGYLLTSVLMFGPTAAFIMSSTEERLPTVVESIFGRPFEEVTIRWHAVHQHVLRQADEARSYLS